MADWTVTVEIARGVAINTVPSDPGDWDDITADVQAFTVSRFDVNTEDSNQAGQATFRLVDNDRTYDPEIDTDLVPGLPIRVQVNYNAVDYDVWYGYCESFELFDDNPALTTVTVKASTALSWLPDGISSPWDYEVFNNGAGDAVWLFEESSQTSRNLYGTGDAQWVKAVTAVNQPLLGAETWYHTLDGDQYARVASYSPPKALPLAVEFICRFSSTIADGTYTLVSSYDGTRSMVIQAAVANPDVTLTAWSSLKSGSNGVAATVSLETLQDPTCIAYRVTSGAEQILVNGAAETTSSVSAPTAPTQTGVWFGGGDGAGRLNFVGDMSAVAAFKVDPTEANLTGHYDAMLGSVDDYTFDRVGRLLDMAGWPSGLRDLDGTGLVRCAPFDHTGRKFRAEVGVLAATENGALFVSGDGKITTHDRLYEVTDASAVTATFSDDGSDLKYRTGLRRTYDWKDVVKSVTADSRPTGDSYTATTTGTVRTQRTLTITTVANNSSELETLAASVLSRLESPEPRLAALMVRPSRDEANLMPALLGLEIGDRVKVERTPQATGAQWTREYIVVGITHSPTPEVWGDSVLELEPAVESSSTAFWNPGTSSPTGTDRWAP